MLAMSGVMEGNVALPESNPELHQRRGHSDLPSASFTGRDSDPSLDESTSLHEVTVEDDIIRDDDDLSQVAALASMENIAHDPTDLIESVETDEAVKLGYHPLDFNFGILKSWVLIVTMVVWSAVIGGVVALTIIGSLNPSALHIRVQSNYYGLRYGPSVIGTITTIWWRAITQSYNRIIPYVVMANMRLTRKDENPKETIMAQTLNALDVNAINVGAMSELYKSRHYVTLIVNLTSFLVPVLVPLKGSFIQITLDSSGWGVNVQPAIGWMIATFYSVLLGTTLAILLRLSGKVTGLKWNPCSLAAQIALLQDSNVPTACEGLEFCSFPMLTERIRNWGQEYGVLRLGYWRNKQRPEELFHCIRFMSCSQVVQAESDCSASLSPERLRGERHNHSTTKSPSFLKVILGRDAYGDCEKPTAYIRESHMERYSRYWGRPLVDFRYLGLLPIYLNDLFIVPLLLVLLASLVTLAITLGSGTIFQVHSYAKFIHGTFERGLLFTFLPSFVISATNIVFQQSDTYHRMLQPIRGMDKPTAARKNILVDYISPNPLATIYTALYSGHYRVAWGTFVALICPLGPVVATGIFTFDDDAQTFQASPVSTYAVLAIVCLYIPVLPFARMDAKYAAGRGLWNIIDTLSLCYDSPILQCPEFQVREKTEDEEIFLQCRVILAKRRYQFGYYLGESGRRRMGFSVATLMFLQPNNSSDLVRSCWFPEEGEEDRDHETFDVVDRIKTRFGFWRFNLVWFRRPQIVKGNWPRGPRRADTEMAVGGNIPGGDASIPSAASWSESATSGTYEMTALNNGVVGGESETARTTAEAANEQLREDDFAQSTAVQLDDQEVNTLLRRQSTLRVDESA